MWSYFEQATSAIASSASSLATVIQEQFRQTVGDLSTAPSYEEMQLPAFVAQPIPARLNRVTQYVLDCEKAVTNLIQDCENERLHSLEHQIGCRSVFDVTVEAWKEIEGGLAVAENC